MAGVDKLEVFFVFLDNRADAVARNPGRRLNDTYPLTG